MEEAPRSEGFEYLSAKFEDESLFDHDFPIPEIEELRGPTESILLRLRENIDRGDYRVLIGDDASGRIPALVFYEALKKIYEGKGFDSPKTFFFAGSGAGYSASKLTMQDAFAKGELIGEYLEHAGVRKLVGNSGKILIVTDTIATGSSLEPLTWALTRAGIRYDIATIGLLTENAEETAEIEKKLGSKIYYGIEETPSLYLEKGLSGVQKNTGDVFSVPVGEKYSREDIADAREDAKKLGIELADDFLSSK